MPLDVLGRTVCTDSLALFLGKFMLTVFVARYTDRVSEYITLAERSG